MVREDEDTAATNETGGSRTLTVSLNEEMIRSPPPPPPGWGRLVFCATGIVVCFLYYGMLQEWLFQQQQRKNENNNTDSQENERLGPTFALVLACCTNVAVALVWQAIQKRFFFVDQQTETNKHDKDDQQPQPRQRRLPHTQLFLTAGCYSLAMGCSNEAIPLVSYPVMVLAKSCKLIPLMMVGQLLEGAHVYQPLEWLAALCISTGIVLFQYSRLRQQQQQSLAHRGGDDTENHSNVTGMLLLVTSLFFDGALSSCQNRLKRAATSQQGQHHCRAPTAVETMLYINLYALAYLIPWSIWSGQWEPGMRLMCWWKRPSSISSTAPSLAHHVLLLNLAVAVGQVFIFLCITWYSPLVTTTITTTRKFGTILLSVYRFGHVFTLIQWVGIGLVFGGLYLVLLVQQQQQQQQQQQPVSVKRKHE